MRLNDPSDFDLAMTGGTYRLCFGEGPAKFTAPASTRGIAKLYTISDDKLLVYVGTAQQPMSARLRSGFRADGKSGYYGYKWKGHEGTLRLSVWTAQVGDSFASLRELETIEAEVVFLCRKRSGRWPTHQHEIHFYPSDQCHHEAAYRIYSHAVRTRG